MSDAEVKIKGLKKIYRRLGYLAEDVFTQKLKDEIGNFIVFKIEERTLKGEDVDGKDFKPYSEKYAEKREETGRSTDVVNLTWSGAMLSAMTFESGPDSIRAFFQNTEDKSGTSNAAKAYFLNEERTFFALSDEEKEQIHEIVHGQIKKVMKKR